MENKDYLAAPGQTAAVAIVRRLASLGRTKNLPFSHNGVIFYNLMPGVCLCRVAKSLSREKK